MERRLKHLVLSGLIDFTLQFGMAFFVSWVGLKILVDLDWSHNFMVTNLWEESRVMVGLSLLYLIYFFALFYRKVDRYIFDEVDKLLRSIRENSYEEDFESYEFEKIAATLNKNKEEIIKKDQDLIKGISYISHDMKTPLTVINTNIALIKANKNHISSKNLQRLERIYEESNKISSYIDQIMKVAKSQLEEDKVYKIRLDDLLDSIEKNIEIYSDMLEEEIGLSRNIANHSKAIHGNLANINECLIQLLNNAYEHKKRKMRVEIIATDNLEISVIDDGVGFDEKILGASTDLFVTSNIGRTSGKGYGIGLYYVKTYMDKISGELKLLNGKNGTKATMAIEMEDDYD